jgi:hypothetical protein
MTYKLSLRFARFIFGFCVAAALISFVGLTLGEAFNLFAGDASRARVAEYIFDTPACRDLLSGIFTKGSLSALLLPEMIFLIVEVGLCVEFFRATKIFDDVAHNVDDAIQSTGRLVALLLVLWVLSIPVHVLENVIVPHTAQFIGQVAAVCSDKVSVDLRDPNSGGMIVPSLSGGNALLLALILYVLRSYLLRERELRQEVSGLRQEAELTI